MFPATVFVTCAQGLEPLLEEEIKEIGFPGVKAGFRGVYVSNVDLNGIYLLNYSTRIGGRVLLPLEEFKCYDQKALYQGVSRVDWRRYLRGNRTFAIDANVSHRQIKNSHYAALLAKDAICDQLRDQTGKRPNIDVKDPDVQLNLFVHERHAVISLDTSGAPLYKRGYRMQSVEAPMQESLAAALLRLAKYSEEEVMIDTCCGSGTLLIEAALIATNTAPGFLRTKWGFANLPEYDSVGWLKVKNEVDAKRKPMPKGHLLGLDINQAAIQSAKVNARAAGVHQYIELVHTDFREYEPTVGHSLLITNPPHGNRLGEAEVLKPLYRSLGDFMKRQMAIPGRGFVFTANLDLSKEVGLSPKKRHVMHQSGEECRFLEFDLF